MSHEHEDMEMQAKSSSDVKDNATDSAPTSDSAPDDKPPKPPKRDYALESNNTEYSRVNKRKILGASFPPRVVFVSKSSEETPEWMSCLQKCVVVINLFIWLLGAVITAIGIWVKVDQDFWTIQSNLDLTQFSNAGWVLIGVGVIIMIVGFVGCYGAIASKIWMLVIFAIVIIILMLMEVAVMALVWSVAANESMKEDIKLKATKALQEMNGNQAKTHFMDLIQSKLKCCGISGPDDYSKNSAKPIPIPNSCTDSDNGGKYTKGCYDAIVEFLKEKAAILGGVAVAVLLLQLTVLILAVCLVCGIKNSATNIIF